MAVCGPWLVTHRGLQTMLQKDRHRRCLCEWLLPFMTALGHAQPWLVSLPSSLCRAREAVQHVAVRSPHVHGLIVFGLQVLI